mgnify:CR=1 FL=1|tara:strand:- start:830 stop:4297 length:3468 start_codon:yes stop_codon:yes gene_type:complete
MSYSFNKDYSSLSGIAIPLNIYDRDFNLALSNTSSIPITGDRIYSGKLGGIYAVPNFLNANATVSDTNFFIDFGDGTIVENNLSAFHEYKTSGNFPITLVVTTSSGFLFRSQDNYMLNVKDPVPDKIFITQDSQQQNESEGTVKFFITRFNNLNTSSVLSANNYKINLSVDKNASPLENVTTYINNPDFQYKNKSFFFTSPDVNFEVIDSVETTSDFIYGKYLSGELQVSTTSATDTILLGTSGFGTFHYYEPGVVSEETVSSSTSAAPPAPKVYASTFINSSIIGTNNVPIPTIQAYGSTLINTTFAPAVESYGSTLINSTIIGTNIILSNPTTQAYASTLINNLSGGIYTILPNPTTQVYGSTLINSTIMPPDLSTRSLNVLFLGKGRPFNARSIDTSRLVTNATYQADPSGLDSLIDSDVYDVIVFHNFEWTNNGVVNPNTNTRASIKAFVERGGVVFNADEHFNYDDNLWQNTNLVQELGGISSGSSWKDRTASNLGQRVGYPTQIALDNNIIGTATRSEGYKQNYAQTILHAKSNGMPIITEFPTSQTVTTESIIHLWDGGISGHLNSGVKGKIVISGDSFTANGSTDYQTGIINRMFDYFARTSILESTNVIYASTLLNSTIIPPGIILPTTQVYGSTLINNTFAPAVESYGSTFINSTIIPPDIILPTTRVYASTLINSTFAPAVESYGSTLINSTIMPVKKLVYASTFINSSIIGTNNIPEPTTQVYGSTLINNTFAPAVESYGSTFINSTIIPNDPRQIGQSILNENAQDYSGIATSTNQNGNIIAIGAPGNDGGGANSGHVRVYYYINNTWSQMGGDIDGEAANDEFGMRIELNHVGNIVAIGSRMNDGNGNNSGHVRVYQYINNTWTQLGQDIDGVNANDNSGFSVSINGAGDRVAIGARGDFGNDDATTGAGDGYVTVFSYNSATSTWIQLGQVLTGLYNGDQFGYDLSMDQSGDRVAIAAVNIGASNLNENRAGNTRVYEYSLATSTWTQLGSDIIGESYGDYSGLYEGIQINAAGNIIAIGAPGNDGGGSMSGHVRVYYYTTGTGWSQMGGDIDGEAAGDQFGAVVYINDAGNKIAGATLTNRDPGSVAKVRVFSYSSNTWTQVGSDFNDFGQSISMNGAGDQIVIGDGRISTGITRVFET